MNYTLKYSIQDGLLTSDTGRIIIYKDCILRSKGPSMDHNDLCFAFARTYGFSSSEVRSKASRYYYRQISANELIISPVRKIDQIDAQQNPKLFDRLIQSEFGRS